jgi:ADP-heptose:LPS heptosyltransferase
MLTAAVRDLHRSHPGKFVTDVRTPRPDLWENNPYLTPLDESDPEVAALDVHDPLIHQSNQLPYHFIHGYRKYVAEKLGVPIQQGLHMGDIHMTPAERVAPGPVERKTDRDIPYWVVVNGGKPDFTTKWWHPGRMQEVVDRFKGRITFAQTGLAEHGHPSLVGDHVINLMDCHGRDYIRLIYHAEGVITPISFAMHLAAAVPYKPGLTRWKPCVVIAGGRESPTWESYPGHQFLHTMGALTCCAHGGCWKARVVRLEDGQESDNHLCEHPIERDGVHIAKCMDLVSTEDVVRAIEKYLEFGR